MAWKGQVRLSCEFGGDLSDTPHQSWTKRPKQKPPAMYSMSNKIAIKPHLEDLHGLLDGHELCPHRHVGQGGVADDAAKALSPLTETFGSGLVGDT